MKTIQFNTKRFAGYTATVVQVLTRDADTIAKVEAAFTKAQISFAKKECNADNAIAMRGRVINNNRIRSDEDKMLYDGVEYAFMTEMSEERVIMMIHNLTK